MKSKNQGNREFLEAALFNITVLSNLYNQVPMSPVMKTACENALQIQAQIVDRFIDTHPEYVTMVDSILKTFTTEDEEPANEKN